MQTPTLPLFGWLAVAHLAVASVGAFPVRAENAATPLSLEIVPTQRCAGVEWFIAGDDDQDCTVSVQFRALPTGPWRQAQPLLRVEPGSYNAHNVDPGNLLAGSLFDLEAGSDYEARLTLSDPDGGAADVTLPFRTRDWPWATHPLRIRHVVPGAGGGSGSVEDPFRGIAAADQNAVVGDLFLLAAGVYSDSLDLVSSGQPGAPIVWCGVDREQTIIDGESLPYSVIELQGNHDVQFQNLTVRRPWSRCVLGSGTKDIAFVNCTIDCSTLSGHEMFGLDFREARHERLFVSDCEIVGPLAWEDGRNEDHYGLIAIGQEHVFRHNRIHGLYDAISVGGDRDSVETSNCDLYGNELYDLTDDGVEFDASRHNIRCFDNRITNALTGFSCQPVYGGPIYMLRNVVYNWQLKPLKFHGYPTGMIVVNNTFVGADPRGFGGGEWRRAILRNNLVLGGSNAGVSGLPICIDTRGIRADFDYDGWYQVDPARFARFNNVNYSTLAAFRTGTGLEAHALLIDYSIFVDAEEPTLGPYQGNPTYFPPYAPGSADLRLAAGATAIDAGLPLSNLNDGWLGSAPDLGAYESGRPLPNYGPGADPVVAVPMPSRSRARSPLRILPNPASGALCVEWDRAEPSAAAAIEVFDPLGRCVRTSRCSDLGRWSWDGRDGDGKLLPAGAYFLRVSREGAEAAARILLVR